MFRGGRGRMGGRGGHVYQSGIQGGTPLEQARNYVLKLSTHVKDPDTQSSRIYVGNLNSKTVNREHLLMEFSKFGEITAIGRLIAGDASENVNYSFVQFDSDESALRAAEAMDGAYFHGAALDVKLAEYKNTEASRNHRLGYNNDPSEPVVVTNQCAMPRRSFNNRPPAHSQNGYGPVGKRPTIVSSHGNDYQASRSKKSRMESDVNQAVIPDILVCGNCHQYFSDIEIMINHKRRPCKPKIKCRCKGENVPDTVTCAICYKEQPTPWALIRHIHKVHSLRICSNLNSQGEIETDGDSHANQADESPEIGSPEGYDELLDPDTDLMEDEEPEAIA